MSETENMYERFYRNTGIDLHAEIATGGSGDGGLVNYYTKDEVDTALSNKANAIDVDSLDSRVDALEVAGPTEPDLTNYYNKSEVDTALSSKSDTGHNHDTRYYTETETNNLLSAKADSSAVTAHVSSTSNPHSVTKSQVGLSNVDNTSDLAKPISTATQSALNNKSDTGHTHDSRYYTETETDTLLSGKASTADLTAHTSNTSNPHGVTKTQVGLANVDNTSDLSKPISTATQTALNAKADTSALATHTGNTSNPHAVTKSQVGLGNVDNTSDANKPISTATQTALSGKSDTNHTHDTRYYTETETDTLLAGKSPLAHVHTKEDQYEYIPTPSTISGVVGTRLTIPTHVTPSGGQTTHPSVVFIPEGWNGYKYWMAHTPYPAGNDAHEDPNICASNDGITWVVPAGLTNPIDDQNSEPAFNSDVDLRLVNNTLYLFWRTYDTGSVGAEEKLYYSTSTNGITWAAKALVYTANETVLRMVSPTFIWEGDHWTMYAVDVVPSPNRVVRLTTSGTSPAQGQWTSPTTVAVGTMQSGKEPWHMSIIKHAGRYVGLLTDCNIDQSGIAGDILFISSSDGTTFTNSGTTIIPRVQSGEHDSLYRATLIPSAEKGILGYRVWYSAWLNQSPAVWNIYRTWVGPTSGTTANAKAFGSTTTANLATGAAATIPITFPAGRFTAAPFVSVSTNAGRLTFAVTNVTTSGCNIIAANWSPATASSIEIYWKAEEKV